MLLWTKDQQTSVKGQSKCLRLQGPHSVAHSFKTILYKCKNYTLLMSHTKTGCRQKFALYHLFGVGTFQPFPIQPSM